MRGVPQLAGLRAGQQQQQQRGIGVGVGMGRGTSGVQMEMVEHLLVLLVCQTYMAIPKV